MTQTNLNLLRINTTAFMEEDFLLMTSLTEKQIIEVIKPIVEKERERQSAMFEGENPEPVFWSDLVPEYDNGTLIEALIKEYPKDTIVWYQLDGIETIEI